MEGAINKDARRERRDAAGCESEGDVVVAKVQRKRTEEDMESRYSKETGEYAAVGGSRQVVVAEVVVGGVSGSEQARA